MSLCALLSSTVFYALEVGQLYTLSAEGHPWRRKTAHHHQTIPEVLLVVDFLCLVHVSCFIKTDLLTALLVSNIA